MYHYLVDFRYLAKTGTHNSAVFINHPGKGLGGDPSRGAVGGTPTTSQQSVGVPLGVLALLPTRYKFIDATTLFQVLSVAVPFVCAFRNT